MTNLHKKIDEREAFNFRIDRKYGMRLRKYCYRHKMSLQQFLEGTMKKVIEELIC